MILRDNKINPIEVRKSVLKMLFNSGAGHLGSNMSVIETIMSMYYCINVEKIKNQDFDRSRIIISKGHCSAATCAVMAHFGIIYLKPRLRIKIKSKGILLMHTKLNKP